MHATLRPLTADDIKTWLLLTLTEEEQNHSQLGNIEEILDDVGEKGAMPTAIYAGETLVGFLSYSVVPNATRSVLHHLLIGANYRRRGYAEQAIRELINLLHRDTQCHELGIPYMSFNENASALYEKMGFIEENHEDEPGDRFALLQIRG